jgi:hypothetical protein
MKVKTFTQILADKLESQDSSLHSQTPSNPSSKLQFSQSADCIDFFAWYSDNLAERKKSFVFHKKFAETAQKSDENLKETTEVPFEESQVTAKYNSQILVCWEFFNRHGAQLSLNFDEGSLKKAWHKMAYKYHPDTSNLNKDDAHDLFVELQEAYQILLAIPKNSNKAA